jgi:hypothetical protein
MATNTNTPQTQITTAEIDPTTATTIEIPIPVEMPAPAAASAPGNPLTAPGPGTPVRVVDEPDPDIPHETAEQERGVGVEGETVVWEARYALKNFLGRLIGMGLLLVCWLSLAIYAWGYRDQPSTILNVLTTIGGIAVAILGLALLRRLILARYGHYYRLTNRRLFVSTGLLVRRRDQMELLKVEDVYTKQTFTQRVLSLGTVVVVSRDAHFPIMYLTGVDDPKGIMDLIWHHARAERDRRSMKVESV